MGETAFKVIALKALKEAFPKAYILKTQERGRKGVPDILLCLNGFFIGIELKRDGEEATKLQAHVLRKIMDAGGYAFVAKPSTFSHQLHILRGRFA